MPCGALLELLKEANILFMCVTRNRQLNTDFSCMSVSVLSTES